MIRVENITVSFAEKTILKDFSLIIPNGKISVILGRSGCGKSVLLKTIDGLFIPDKGRVFIEEQDVFSLRKKELKKIRKNIGFLFQGGALFDSLNVYQNVAFPLVEHTKLSEDKIAVLVNEKLKLVGLPDVLLKFPSELSGGMRKRVALARAIIQEPNYIFYDEPTTGLDPITSHEIIELISKIQKELQITSVIITHDIECIYRLAEKVSMIHDGGLLFDGDKEDFYKFDHPLCHAFLKDSVVGRVKK